MKKRSVKTASGKAREKMVKLDLEVIGKVEDAIWPITQFEIGGRTEAIGWHKETGELSLVTLSRTRYDCQPVTLRESIQWWEDISYIADRFEADEMQDTSNLARWLREASYELGTLYEHMRCYKKNYKVRQPVCKFGPLKK